MQRTSNLVLLLMLIGAALPGCKEVQSNPSVEAVHNFYTWHISSQMTGAPTPTHLAKMAPFLSAELHSLLSEASAEYIAKHGTDPNDTKERSIARGDWFTSMFDGPTSFITGEPELNGDGFIVPVRFTSAQQLPAVNWNDRIKVIQENGRYVVADVQFENHWIFGENTSLLNTLKKPQALHKRRKA